MTENHSGPKFFPKIASGVFTKLYEVDKNLGLHKGQFFFNISSILQDSQD